MSPEDGGFWYDWGFSREWGSSYDFHCDKFDSERKVLRVLKSDCQNRKGRSVSPLLQQAKQVFTQRHERKKDREAELQPARGLGDIHSLLLKDFENQAHGDQVGTHAKKNRE